MDTVLDSTGRVLQINLDFGTKRVFIVHTTPGGPSTTVATLTSKQSLKLAALLTGHVRHILGPDPSDPDDGL